MSFAEFSYPVMQAWDWWYMFHTKGIQMQIGGSDQFGNIIAGIDAVKYVATHHPDPNIRDVAKATGEPFGFTVPLLTAASGQKFGKSAGNAIWLDNEQTSAFDLYGYFVRTADADVEKHLKMFTFLPSETIDELMKEHVQEPSTRKAQHALARELVELVHGEHEAKAREAEHKALFSKGGSVVDPDAKAGIITPNNRPKVNLKLPRSLINNKSISKILFATGLVESGSAGHRLAANGGAYIGGPPHLKKEAMSDASISWHAITTWKPEDTRLYLIHGDLLLFRRGAHNIRIVQVVSDEDYVISGEAYPGMSKEWKKGVLKAMAVNESITKEDKAAVEKLLQEEMIWSQNLRAKDEPDVKVKNVSGAGKVS